MIELYDFFPYLKDDKIIIRKMTLDDVESLFEITNNENVYKFVPPFLYKKNIKFLHSAIENLGGRDFEKKKRIIAGIYLNENSEKLVGLSEMFDYKKRDKTITIGYMINEMYWNQGIATNAVKLMINYLSQEVGINTIKAFVMPENINSAKVLLSHGFIKEDYIVQQKNWGGHDIVDTEVYTFTS